jgi:hypothetical protein
VVDLDGEEAGMRFKDLPVGAEFRFTDPSEFSVGRTYVKVSARRYCAEPEQLRPFVYQVGSVNVEVTVVEEEVKS